MMIRKIHRTAVRLILLFVCLFLMLNSLLCDHVSEEVLESNALHLTKKSSFNPRRSTYAIYSFVNTYNKGNFRDSTSSFGNEYGELFFHWDDWIDMYPANDILNKFRSENLEGHCGRNVESFADVSGFFLETYSRKVARGMTNLYCMKKVPENVILVGDNSYIQVPVASKKRLGLTNMLGDIGKSSLIQEMKKIESTENQRFNSWPRKPLQNTVEANYEDFIFNPDDEIFKLKSKLQDGTLSPSDHKYLEFLEYSNHLVDHTDTYFKYPWIITDIISQHSHHIAYPFFKRYVSNRERQSIVHHMTRAWFQFAESIGIVSWLNYGSLLGWSFNGVNMPWDPDVDIQVPIVQLVRLAREFNESLIVENPRYGNAKYYLEVAPTYVRQGNGKNFIDARFIDINSGLYIDISALSHTSFEPPRDLFDGLSKEEKLKSMPIHCKNWNWHTVDEIFPLRHTLFEGGSAYIPKNVTRILTRKYGKESYTSKRHYSGHNYQKDIMLWVPDNICKFGPKRNRFADVEKTALTFKGACRSKVIQDEYKIVRQSADTHTKFESVDFDFDNSLGSINDLPIFRKDPWDYYNDLGKRITQEEGWFLEIPTIL